MLTGSFAEVLSIGAVLPFLAVLVAPDRVFALPLVGGWVSSLEPNVDRTWWFSLTFVILLLISTALRLLLAWVSQGFAQQASLDLAKLAFHKLVHQPYEFYVRQHSSEIIARFELIYGTTQGVLVSGVQALISGLIASMLILFLLAVNPFVAVVAAGVLVGAYGLALLAVRRTLSMNSAVIENAWTKRVRNVQEALGAIRDILLDRTQPVFESSFADNAARLTRALRLNNYLTNAPRIIVDLVGVLLIIGLALALSREPGGLVAAIPTLGALALAGQRLIPLLSQGYNGWSQVRSNQAALRSVAEFINLPVAEASSGRPSANPPFASEIVFDGVSFGYAERPEVLDGISFRVAAGERIGIVGPTGSGKSTLIDVILGLLPPTFGQISIDGQILTPRRYAWWQRQIAHVPQTIYLSDDSIASNIALGVPSSDIDHVRVQEAAKAADMHAFIQTLPLGYATECGERGARLSGGQRQRIGIARALYKRATVLLLDEATSSLDNASERSVMSAVNRLPANLTIIIVAHRLSTLAECDRILCLENGRISREVTSIMQLD